MVDLTKLLPRLYDAISNANREEEWCKHHNGHNHNRNHNYRSYRYPVIVQPPVINDYTHCGRNRFDTPWNHNGNWRNYSYTPRVLQPMIPDYQIPRDGCFGSGIHNNSYDQVSNKTIEIAGRTIYFDQKNPESSIAIATRNGTITFPRDFSAAQVAALKAGQQITFGLGDDKTNPNNKIVITPSTDGSIKTAAMTYNNEVKIIDNIDGSQQGGLTTPHEEIKSV